jgi:hypothetical protein
MFRLSSAITRARSGLGLLAEGRPSSVEELLGILQIDENNGVAAFPDLPDRPEF